MGTSKKKKCPTPWKKVETKEEAHKHAGALYRKEGKAALVKPYLCVCGNWHVGGRKKSRGPKRKQW